MTLLELLVVISLIAILSGFVANILYYEINMYDLVTTRKAVVQDARFAVRLMSRDIRQIMAADSIYNASSDSLSFRDVSDNVISYAYQNSELRRNGDLLISGASSFSFAYFDNDGALMSFPITEPDQIRSVTFSLTTSENEQSITSQISVMLRNF